MPQNLAEKEVTLKATTSRLLAALALAVPFLTITPTHADALTLCGSSQQYAFNDRWLGTFCVYTNSSNRILSTVMKGAVNGFPNFSGCQVYAHWWTSDNIISKNSGWVTCSSFVSQQNATTTFGYSLNPLSAGHQKICGTFIFKNTGKGQYWGPAQAVCVNI